MLTRLKKLFSGKSGTPSEQHPVALSGAEHQLSPDTISKGARSVVEILEQAGYQGFLVGGCVRDLLLGLHPKDFDVATNATPEQAKGLFRRARIVGRRFQIVHVHMGREIVEVTTFRAHHDSDSNTNTQGLRSDTGVLLRDNVFGDICEDASRRDFTVNALYYHPTDNTIYDYARGIEHIRQRQLKILGDPETRFREDPVRMLRALRFAAKLDFQLEQQTAAPIGSLGHLLTEVPPARLFDEFLKLFFSGHALKTFQLLRQFHLFGYLFPDTDKLLEKDDGYYQRFLEQALVNTDARILENRRVTPAFLLAALLWPPVREMAWQQQTEAASPLYAMQQAAGLVTARQLDRIALPRRFSQPMREIWELQVRLTRRSGNRATELLEQPRFRAGYDFVLLREQAGEDLGGLGQWWSEFQEADPVRQSQMVDSLKERRRRPRRRPRGPRQRSGRPPGANQSPPGDASDNNG